ncbi:MAG: polysaccharide deacetylase family protein [Sphingomonadaceae bacterium]
MILNFHGIGTCVRPFEPDEKPYWISIDLFENILGWVKQQARPVRMSFDDGNVSDYTLALPRLTACRTGADFFVLAGKIGQKGYLDATQIREISDTQGCRIGSHGLHHRAWPDISADNQYAEIYQSRSILEDIIQRPVIAAALPFGRYNRQTLRLLKQAGYQEIYSSDGISTARASVPAPRFSITSQTSLPRVELLAQENANKLARWRQQLRVWIKAHG